MPVRTRNEDDRGKRLQNGELFPSIAAPMASGDELRIYDDLEGRWSILIFYRGHW